MYLGIKVAYFSEIIELFCIEMFLFIPLHHENDNNVVKKETYDKKKDISNRFSTHWKKT